MLNYVRFSFFSFLIYCLLKGRSSYAMIHHFDFDGDSRMLVQLTSFGFGLGGNLTVSIQNLVPPSNANSLMMGFTLDKAIHSQQSEILPSWDEATPNCVLRSIKNDSNHFVIFWFDFQKTRLLIERHGNMMTSLSVGKTPKGFVESQVPAAATLSSSSAAAIPHRVRRSSSYLSDTYLFSRGRRGVPGSSAAQLAAATTGAAPVQEISAADTNATVKNSLPREEFNGSVDWIPLNKWTNSSGATLYNCSFTVQILNETEEGLYNLAFHNCERQKMRMRVQMIEMNGKNYLSVGEAPLPLMYFIFFIIFLTAALFWHWLLYVSTEGVCKIHYVMLVLIYIKSVSILFHGINLQFMQNIGQKQEAFAILFYIVYLLKGIVMFLTIVLIGAGWTFVRHILSDRDKKIFVIVIPLQILINVATIVVEESEQGQESYTLWKELMIFLDLVCCGAILFPIVGSIRHLHQASQTDGKAAVNLEKLKIFRHFYILVVCFIYFTRIIVLLVGITVPFRYLWLDRFFVELATLGFFLLTGYKFRPASNNPYLMVSMSDDEDDDAESLTKNGALETVTRVNFKPTTSGSRSRGGQHVEEGGSDDEYEVEITQSGRRSAADQQPLLKQREASHEYD